MGRLAPLFVAALAVLVAGCGGDEGDSRHFGGNDASGDTATVGDIGFVDTTAKDQAGLDTVVPDTSDEAGQPVEVAACDDECPAINTRECVDGASWRSCTTGGLCLVWSDAQACASDEKCEDGSCVFEGPDCSGLPTGCDHPGARRCSPDAKAVEECNGGYECPKWEAIEACQPGEVCANGACGGGAGNCAELEACVDTTCADAVASGSNIKLFQCTLQHCRSEYEGCLGPFGGGACKDLLKCAQSCQDEQCQKACTSTATFEANVQFVDVGVCLEDNCPGALADPMGNVQCIVGTCGTPLNACCDGNIMTCM